MGKKRLEFTESDKRLVGKLRRAQILLEEEIKIDKINLKSHQESFEAAGRVIRLVLRVDEEINKNGMHTPKERS